MIFRFFSVRGAGVITDDDHACEFLSKFYEEHGAMPSVRMLMKVCHIGYPKAARVFKRFGEEHPELVCQSEKHFLSVAGNFLFYVIRKKCFQPVLKR